MSHIRTIIPLNLEYNDLVSLIRKVFGLNEDPYENMDSYIILLAFVPKCNFTPDLLNEFNNRYGTCDHQTLEFYGDRILYGVIANIIYDFFGLTMNPHFYTTLNSILTKNRLLTDIMIDKQACELVRSRPYSIREGAKFHNICADSFEALIGAIFIHLKTIRLDYMTHIKNWLLKNTGLPYVLKQYLNDVGFSDKTVYVINDRDKLRTQWIHGYETLQDNLIARKSLIDTNTYEYLISAYSKSKDVTINDFAFTGIIINPNTSLDKMFDHLKWPYFGPVQNDNGYIIEGIPGGIPTVIGSGSSPQEAIENAINYLFSRGHLVPMKNISLQYSTGSSQQSIQPIIPIMPKLQQQPTSIISQNIPVMPSIQHRDAQNTYIQQRTGKIASVIPSVHQRIGQNIPVIPSVQQRTGQNISVISSVQQRTGQNTPVIPLTKQNAPVLTQQKSPYNRNVAGYKQTREKQKVYQQKI